MGGQVTINDTLNITKEQGFPEELDYEQHKKEPIVTEKFKDRIFEFKNKEGIRIYQPPPIRNFLVQNIGGKWLYWGLISIIEVKHDTLNKTTSGRFKIIYIYSPEEMKFAHKMINRDLSTDYLATMKNT